MPDSSDQRVICPHCDKAYRWQAKLVGRPVDCKKCGNRFTVAPLPGVGIAPEPAPPEDAEADGLYDLAVDAEGRTAADPEPRVRPAVGGKCPSCNSKVAESAVICLNCGFNMKEGKTLKPKIAELSVKERKKEKRPKLSGMRLVQVGLWMHLAAILLTLGSIALPFAAVFLGEGFMVAFEYTTYVATALALIGSVLCLAAPKESGGRIVLIASIILNLAAGFTDGFMADQSSLIGGLLSIASVITFLYFFVMLARYLDFPQITERAEKVLGLYVLLLIASILTIIPLFGCFAAIFVIGCAIYAAFLYILLLIDLNNAVNFRIHEEAEEE